MPDQIEKCLSVPLPFRFRKMRMDLPPRRSEKQNDAVSFFLQALVIPAGRSGLSAARAGVMVCDPIEEIEFSRTHFACLLVLSGVDAGVVRHSGDARLSVRIVRHPLQRAFFGRIVSDFAATDA